MTLLHYDTMSVIFEFDKGSESKIKFDGWIGNLLEQSIHSHPVSIKKLNR